MPTIAEVRKQYPQYSDLSDGQLADALHSKFYSDMPRDQFNAKIGLGSVKGAVPAPQPSLPASTPALRAAQAHDAKLDARDGAQARDAARANMQSYSFNTADEALAARDAVATGFKSLIGQNPGYTPQEAYAARMQQEAARLDAYRKQHPGKALGAEVVGALVNPVNFVGGGLMQGARGGQAVARAGALGGVTGAAYGAGAGTDAKSRLQGAATGGMTGAATGAILQGGANLLRSSAARAAARPASPARQLAQEGIRLTPGQMAGGMVQRAEDAATSVPILGDAIRSARVEGIESFNKAAINRALKPIGQELPAGVSVGRDGVREASAAISNAYDQALSPITVAPDAQLLTDLAAIKLPAAAPKALQGELKVQLADVKRRLASPTAGNDWKTLDSDLRQAIDAAATAQAEQSSQRFLKEALIDTRGIVQGLLARTDPAAAAAVKKADEATANLARIRQASQMVGAKEGVFTPGQLSNAVRSTDSSASHRAYAQGDALMQDLSDNAQAVLPSTVPDSGTPFRGLMSTLGLSGGGVMLGAEPTAVAAGVGGLLGAGAVYSRPAQEAINAVYRAATPGQARIQLARLSEMAAREPALQAVVAQLRERLDGPASGRSSAPQGLLSTPHPQQ